MKVTLFSACMALYLALPGFSSADIFRCQRPSGEVVFQSTPCPEGNGIHIFRNLGLIAEGL